MGEVIIFKRNDNIGNIESILHILFIRPGVQAYQVAWAKCSGYEFKQLQQNLLIFKINKYLRRNIAWTESRPGTYLLTAPTHVPLSTRCSAAPTKATDTTKETAF